MYVIKNMRRTTPVHKSSSNSLPTIVPFYNVQLVKSVSKVSFYHCVIEELFTT